MTASTRPAAGTRAASIHQEVFRLRRAVADPVVPQQMLAIIRDLPEDRAKACLAVALASEHWSAAERAAMNTPPQPDHDAIAAENRRLRDTYFARGTTDSEVSFAEDAA